MSWTQAQLTALENAMATGVLECEFDGKRTKFRSLADMQALRQTMRAALGLTKRTTRIRMKTYKGLTSESV